MPAAITAGLKGDDLRGHVERGLGLDLHLPIADPGELSLDLERFVESARPSSVDDVPAPGVAHAMPAEIATARAIATNTLY